MTIQSSTPFNEAVQAFNETAQIVTERIGDAKTITDTYTSTVQSALGNLQVNFSVGTQVPQAPTVAPFQAGSKVSFTPPSPNSFGQISLDLPDLVLPSINSAPNLPTLPDYNPPNLNPLQVPQLQLPTFEIPPAPADPTYNTLYPTVPDAPQINDVGEDSMQLDLFQMPALTAPPEFEPSINAVNIPTAPTMSAKPVLPVAPQAPNIDVPDMGALDLPDPPDITQYDIPELSDYVIPPFEPTFSAPTISRATIQYSEPEYVTTALNQIQSKLSALYTTGLPTWLEDALFNRMNDRETALIERDVDSVMTEFARRGFTAPNGMTAARVDQVRADGRLKKQGANRDLAIRAGDVAIENLSLIHI